MFIDLVEIEVESGAGGPGAVSFRREKFLPKGGPDGGDGGNGGSVYLVVDSNLNTLMDLKYRKKYKAEKGGFGKGRRRSGAKGEDVYIRVPPGTLIYDVETDEMLADLVDDGETFMVARGGQGGRGNDHFKSPTNQAPRRADPGRPGEEKKLRLELRLIADVGLVGYPNAGKSSLLKALSRARPKVAEYPFTTLIPNIGIVAVEEFRSLKMADIPGIIEGASRGKGLGLQFLRHIERTSILLYMLDGTRQDFIQDLQDLRTELREYNWRLLSKPELICINKIDLWDDETLELWKTELGDNYLFISAKEEINLDQVKSKLAELMDKKERDDDKRLTEDS